MSLMNEYIDRRLSGQELEQELLRLIAAYNKKRDTFLLIYAVALDKRIPLIPLSTDDYHIIFDLLRTVAASRLDVYLETPGGSGEAAEEIVRFIHGKYPEVAFVVSGEAKSAGTIMVLSGDTIIMTESGSLGPIDAQVQIGRSQVSAYDYIQWVEEKHKEAAETKSLNPVDAVILAQISPGELSGVNHSLEFAKDLLKDWLPRYKFRNWTVTETRRMPVTEKMKREQAARISENLAQHSRWRSHGRSLKIKDLEEIGLRIMRADEDQDLADLIYRMQTVLKLLFATTTAYKIFATERLKIFKHAATGSQPLQMPLPKPDVVQVDVKCPKCETEHHVFLRFTDNEEVGKDAEHRGVSPFPKSGKLKCECGFEMDLAGLRNDLEMKVGKRAIV